MAESLAALDKELAVLRAELEASQEARVLQAKEYERRLQELNHAHQIQTERNAQYISREAFELYTAKVDEWRRAVDQWRWFAIGAGIAGGGLTGGLLSRLMSGV